MTVGDLERTAAKRAAREEREKEEEKRGRGEVGVRELWKPHLGSLDLFEGLGGRCAFTLSSYRVKLIVLK